MRYRGAVRKLAKLGCHEIRRRGCGSHRRWFNPQAQRDALLPNWSERDPKMGTLRSPIRQLDIDWQEVKALMRAIYENHRRVFAGAYGEWINPAQLTWAVQSIEEREE